MRLAAFTFLTTSLFAASYQVTPDIEYSAAGGESLKLDAHIPEGKGPFPAIILVHGGGWTAGHKTVNFVQDSISSCSIRRGWPGSPLTIASRRSILTLPPVWTSSLPFNG